MHFISPEMIATPRFQNLFQTREIKINALFVDGNSLNFLGRWLSSSSFLKITNWFPVCTLLPIGYYVLDLTVTRQI